MPRRELPPWVREQRPRWGEPVRVPEWDDDESLGDGKEVSGCDGRGEKEGEVRTDRDCYRNENGWKVGALFATSDALIGRITEIRRRSFSSQFC